MQITWQIRRQQAQSLQTEQGGDRGGRFNPLWSSLMTVINHYYSLSTIKFNKSSLFARRRRREFVWILHNVLQYTSPFDLSLSIHSRTKQFAVSRLDLVCCCNKRAWLVIGNGIRRFVLNWRSTITWFCCEYIWILSLFFTIIIQKRVSSCIKKWLNWISFSIIRRGNKLFCWFFCFFCNFII